MAGDIVLIHGDDNFLVDSEAARFREAAAGDGVEVETIESPSKLGPVRQSLTEVPLFEPSRLVILRDPPQLSGTARKGADSANELAEILQMRAPSTAVCIVNHAVVAASNPVLAAVTKLGGKVLVRSHPKGRDLRTAVDDLVSRSGMRLPRGAVERLMAVSNGDLGIIKSELDKLRAFAEDTPLTLDDVQRLCNGSEQLEVWNVMERLLGERPGRGVAAVDNLITSARSTQYLMTTLAGQISEIIQTRSLLDSGVSAGAVAGKFGLPPWRAERLVRQARQVSTPVAERWLHELHRLDAAIKAGEASDVDGLRLFIRGAAVDVTAA